MTQPMTVDQLTEWLRPRLAPGEDLDEAVEFFDGWSETDLEALQDAQHGQMA
jgi:hypothetical protein